MLCACVCGSSIMCTGLSAEVVRPFYKERADVAMRILQDELKDAMGPEHPVLVHKPEGCIFLWMWFRDLPISAEELYFRYVLAPACLALPCLALSCLAPAAVRPTYLLVVLMMMAGWLGGWLAECRLKAKGVLIIPGHLFFPGQESVDWAHKHECIRMSYGSLTVS
jgi:valine--pyruvate aminotransferase